MKSTEKTTVQELRKGVYRLTSVGSRSAVTGKFTSPKTSSQGQLSAVSPRSAYPERMPKN
jgi:hypothetical protein